MNILVTGVGGQLGRAVYSLLSQQGGCVKGTTHAELEITDAASVYACFKQCRPDAVVHCAAFSKVDLAEENPTLCTRTNITGTQVIADACKQIGSYLLYISSDYVFDGTKQGAYQVSDEKNPLSVYGRAKSIGEDIVLSTGTQSAVLRTSWLFGHSSNNFVEAILRAGQQRSIIDVVDDQIGSPTYTEDLAILIAEMATKRCTGIYHGTNEGTCSWAQFAARILSIADISAVVDQISSEEYPSKALRPKNSVLSKECLDKAGLHRLPHWEDALVRYWNTRKDRWEDGTS